MKNYKDTGLSLPNEIFLRIERERGDISRSRYVLRLLEKPLQTGVSAKTPQPVAATEKPMEVNPSA